MAKQQRWILLKLLSLKGLPFLQVLHGVAAVKRGTPVSLYACPRCGTVKIDIETSLDNKHS